MAMGQGEQWTLHPFFVKDAPVRRPSGGNNRARPAALELAMNPAGFVPSDDVNAAAAHVRVDRQSATLEQRDFSWPAPSKVCSSSTPTCAPSGLVAELDEEEPNAQRRKRRKTASLECATSDTAIVLSNESSRDGSPHELGTAAHSSGRGGTSRADDKGSTTGQKILKINPNGKLLSSPIANRVEDKPQSFRGGRRKSEGPKKKVARSKLVILKYSCESSAVGKLIEDILSGKQRCPPVLPPVPTSAVPTPAPVRVRPAKPTHPFFLKKAAQKDDVANNIKHTGPWNPRDSRFSDVGQTQDSTPIEPVESSRSTKSFGMPLGGAKGLRSSKFPEPVEPLWPPQGLVHVKDGQAEIAPIHLSSSDQKKAKSAIMSIKDEENLLLFCLCRAKALEGRPLSAEPILRVPRKSVASGPTLHDTVASLLSASPDDSTGHRKFWHNALTKLYFSLPSATSCFDQGTFESHLWAQKYAPRSAEEVLQNGREPSVLRDWLRDLTVHAVAQGHSTRDTEKPATAAAKKAKRRKKADDLEDFIVWSEDESTEMDEFDDSEDELAGDVTVSSKRKAVVRSSDLASSQQRSGADTSRLINMIVLSGPSGCGKTASVYAAAKELEFEVFEIGPGSRRSAKDILERVGDMTRNHLIHSLNGEDAALPDSQSTDRSSTSSSQDDRQQAKMKAFFKQTSSGRPETAARKEATKKKHSRAEPTANRSQKQSLILLEEADLLFEEDRQFWSGVMALLSQSRRPIIITCNDENLVPLDDLSFHAILRFSPPPQALAVDYLLLVAAHEGHVLGRDAVRTLYASSGSDLRRSLMELNFWCQMGVGSEKSGLDWLIDRWPPGSDLDERGNRLRALSSGTYEPFMGWFNRDSVIASSSRLDGHVELLQESLDWFRLSIQDFECLLAEAGTAQTKPRRSSSSLSQEIQALEWISHHADMRSALDLLCSRSSLAVHEDIVDASTDTAGDVSTADYIEGYPVLHAELCADYSSLSTKTAVSFEALLCATFGHGAQLLDDEQLLAAQVLARADGTHERAPMSGAKADFLGAFEPIMQTRNATSLPVGRIAPSFENGLGPIAEDLAPYIRAIVNFDLRLERYRLQLSGLLSAGRREAKRRVRKTRASRAALEGGDKASTRKERWFDSRANPALILATGDRSWQDVLLQMGYLQVGEPASDSSGEG